MVAPLNVEITELPVPLNVTVLLGTATFAPSFKVTVIVEVLLPSARSETGLEVTVELLALTGVRPSVAEAVPLGVAVEEVSVLVVLVRLELTDVAEWVFTLTEQLPEAGIVPKKVNEVPVITAVAVPLVQVVLAVEALNKPLG